MSNDLVKFDGEDEAPLQKVEGITSNYEITEDDLVLPQLRWQGGGATLFRQGDENVNPGFEAIILAHKKIRGWFEKSFEETGGGQYPDCYSFDMKHPDPTVSEEKRCAEKCEGDIESGGCPFSKFGSDRRGKGKACKEYIRALLLIKGQILPTLIQIPATSHKVWKEFITTCLNRGYPIRGMFTEFGLTKTKSSSGMEYAKLILKPKALIAKPENLPNAIKRIDEIAEKFYGQIASAPFAAEDSEEEVPF